MAQYNVHGQRAVWHGETDLLTFRRLTDARLEHNGLPGGRPQQQVPQRSDGLVVEQYVDVANVCVRLEPLERVPVRDVDDDVN